MSYCELAFKCTHPVCRLTDTPAPLPVPQTTLTSALPAASTSALVCSASPTQVRAVCMCTHEYTIAWGTLWADGSSLDSACRNQHALLAASSCRSLGGWVGVSLGTQSRSAGPQGLLAAHAVCSSSCNGSRHQDPELSSGAPGDSSSSPFSFSRASGWLEMDGLSNSHCFSSSLCRLCHGSPA